MRDDSPEIFSIRRLLRLLLACSVVQTLIIATLAIVLIDMKLQSIQVLPSEQQLQPLSAVDTISPTKLPPIGEWRELAHWSNDRGTIRLGQLRGIIDEYILNGFRSDVGTLVGNNTFVTLYTGADEEIKITYRWNESIDMMKVRRIEVKRLR